MEPQDPTLPDGTPQELEDPEVTLRDARQRFIAAFPKRSDSIGLLLGMVATLGARGPIAPLRQVVHRTAGLAGTLGFSAVSLRARGLEDVLEGVEEKGVDTSATDRAFDAIQDAFAHDLSNPPEWVDSSTRVEGKGRLVLLVEDDEDQREFVSIHLKAAGYQSIHVSAGDMVLDIAHARQPDIILLDVNLPGMDGYAVCRLLKASPQVAGIPVIFLTVRASLDDRLVGLMLGADDYMVKPVDMAELLLRMQLLLAKRARADQSPQGRLLKESPELDYETFSLLAHEQLLMLPATLVLVRTPEELLQSTYAALRAESRRRDLVARYDSTHIVLLMGEMPPLKARERLTEMLVRLEPGTPPRLQVGLASSVSAGAKTFETLLAEADEGISLTRQRGELVAMGGEPKQAVPPPAAAVAPPVVHAPAPPAPAPRPPAPAPRPPAPAPRPPAPSPSRPVPAPSAPVPAPSAPVPSPSAPVPSPSAPVPSPSAPVPSPSAPVPSPSTPVPSPSTPTRTFTILLAGEDPEVSRLVDEQVRAAGFKTILAADGAEALSAVELHKPDAMVIDLMMTRMTGLEVLAKLAEVHGRPRVLVLSARGREQDVTRAFALGADDYMTKPFSPQELLARVKRLLR